jgi:outer membrane immunogenic protein
MRSLNRPSILRGIGMPRLTRLILLGTLLGTFLLCLSGASAQIIDQMKVGANYSYVRGEAPPGVCGCFSMNGGSGFLEFDASKHWALVGELSSERASSIGGNPAGLTLTSFSLGPRYSFRHPYPPAIYFTRGIRRVLFPFVPFSEFLVGVVHGSGALTPGPSGLTGSANAFAITFGGGVEFLYRPHLTLRPFQIDYYTTGFSNGVSNRQIDHRIGAGIVIGLWRDRKGGAHAPIVWH